MSPVLACTIATQSQRPRRRNGMAEERHNRSEPLSPWARAFVAIVILGVGAYGVICLIRGRLVTEGFVLEGLSARMVGGLIAVLATILLVRTLHPRWRKQ